ncbi:hypothetical protein SLEP1_g23144 [Rubroshorea leprosula]|uniref:Uncharacterized protein n=1 Tax=Rubroshorea leprosula TaxID=152421 RepID=A0AAV5JGR3_9ROSI|nr:hypothetical protein SLEP1_g23144 [Rubroshorea leprosula]
MSSMHTSCCLILSRTLFFWFPIRYPGFHPDYSGLDQLWRTRMVGGSPNEDCCVHKVSRTRDLV